MTQFIIFVIWIFLSFLIGMGRRLSWIFFSLLFGRRLKEQQLPPLPSGSIDRERFQ